MDYVAKFKPIIIKVSPFGFYMYAKYFFEAGNKCKEDSNYSPVPYYLYCRSIEIVLKSFLLDNNVTRKDLQRKNKFGHDLIKNITGIQDFGMKLLDDQEIKILKKANDYYCNKGFEYFELNYALRGKKDLPDLSELQKISLKLLKNIKIKNN